MPSGSSSDEAVAEKNTALWTPYSSTCGPCRKRRELIICADWNICHKEIDLRNWRANRKNSGFLPEERAWLDTLCDEVGYIDSFRLVNREPDQYTWWSNRGQAWAKNVGWRLDYQVISPGPGQHRARDASIYKATALFRSRPQIMEYDLGTAVELAPGSPRIASTR